MRRPYLLRLVFFACLLAWPAVAAPASAREKIVLATLNWEPYVGESLENQGYAAAVVKEAFRRSSVDVEIRFHQWSRVVGLAKKGRVDGYFPEYYADSIRAYALFSDPFPAGPLGFFKRADSRIEFTALEHLTPYRIGVVQGYINTQAFDEAHYLDKHMVKDDLTNLRLLVSGRVDLVVADKFVGVYLMNQYMPAAADQITFLPTILEKKQLYLCIGKTISKAQHILDAFNRGLSQMAADQRLEKLMPVQIKHPGSPPPGHAQGSVSGSIP